MAEPKSTVEESVLDRFICKVVYPMIGAGRLDATEAVHSLLAGIATIVSKVPDDQAAPLIDSLCDALRRAEAECRAERKSGATQGLL